ncbi:MAG TPA: SpaA isopeptide-forming pilin-related protein [Nocardioidaceae bacterium]|nr:SpaA isopeptide-forming pilin-related protein [Nocardioidaceae bacterium]
MTWTGTAPLRQATKTVDGWVFTGLEDRQATTQDSGFAGGTKQDDSCASVITAKAPNKDDLKRVYVTSKTINDVNNARNGHVILGLSWIRIPQNTTSPSAHIGFEFNAGTSGACAGPGGLVVRTAGDMLIVYDFEGGTAVPAISLRRWVTSGACEVGSKSPPCWGPSVNLTDSGAAVAGVNTGATASDTAGPTNETLGIKEFGEAGIDLTDAGVFAPGVCATFGSAFAVSRSSGSSATAQMKDLVGPGNINITNCGSIKIIKRTAPRGVNQAHSFTSTIPAAGSPAAPNEACTLDSTPASFTLNDSGNTNADNAANTESCTNVPIGSYTVTEGADASNFSFVDVSCTATGTGTSATTSAGSKVASITLAGGGVVTCVYTNRQNLGAILVTKNRKHAADGPSDHPQVGVDITVNGVTKATNSSGQACFDGLPFGDYTVHETVPDGYHVDANDKVKTVDNNAKCTDATFVGETVSFLNMPLTDITVSVDSQIDGGTASTISCVDKDGNVLGSTATDADAVTGGDGSVKVEDLEPTDPAVTLVCTIIVDP